MGGCLRAAAFMCGGQASTGVSAWPAVCTGLAGVTKTADEAVMMWTTGAGEATDQLPRYLAFAVHGEQTQAVP